MKLLSNILTTLIFIALLAVAGLVFATKIPGTHLELKIVKSGSMSPAIPTGSVVLIDQADAYQVGDIITFGEDTKASIPTTHRIVSIREADGTQYFTTKGDANKTEDVGETPREKIIGHVIFSLPYAGYVLAFAREPLGFTFMIGLPAALIILYELFAIFGEVRGMRKKKMVPTQKRISEPVMPEPARDIPVRARQFDIGPSKGPRRFI